MDNKQDKGFTLVELLIVIVILGILATVTVFAVRGITDQGQTSACDADQKTLRDGRGDLVRRSTAARRSPAASRRPERRRPSPSRPVTARRPRCDAGSSCRHPPTTTSTGDGTADCRSHLP